MDVRKKLHILTFLSKFLFDQVQISLLKCTNKTREQGVLGECTNLLTASITGPFVETI